MTARELCSIRELGQKVGSANDGAGQKLGKKRDEQCKVQGRTRGRDAPAIDVDAVAEGLKCIERNSNREDDLQWGPAHLGAERIENLNRGMLEQSGIFEKTEQSEIGPETDRQQPTPSNRIVRVCQSLAHEEVYAGGADDEEDEDGIPRHVESVAGNEQHELARCVPVKHREHEQ